MVNVCGDVCDIVHLSIYINMVVIHLIGDRRIVRANISTPWGIVAENNDRCIYMYTYI